MYFFEEEENILNKVFFVGIGGFFGAILRYLISGWSAKILGNNFPYGTLVANVVACLLIGFITEGSLGVWDIPDNVKLLIVTGILGGLSTFSTFSYETVNIFSCNPFFAMLNVLLNLSFGVIGVIAGKYLVKII